MELSPYFKNRLILLTFTSPTHPSTLATGIFTLCPLNVQSCAQTPHYKAHRVGISQQPTKLNAIFIS